MDRMFNSKRLKDKIAKSKSLLPFLSREKDKAGGTIDDQQAQNNESTPESSTSITDSASPNPVDSSNAPTHPPTSATASFDADDDYENTPIAELWNSAYEKLRKEDKQLIDKYETKLQQSATPALDPVPDNKGDREKWMSLILQQRMEQIQKDAWKFMFLGSEIRPAEMAQSVLKVIKTGQSTTQSQPLLSQALMLRLPGLICLKHGNEAASLAKELKDISSLIIQGRMRESLYQRRYEGQNKVELFPEAHSKYKAALELLYQQILRFQIHCYCYYAQGKSSRLLSDFSSTNDWNSLANDIRQQEAQMITIDKIWRDHQYDDECAASERRYQGTIFNLKTIGADISDLRNAVEGANRDRDQKELLDWLCDIDPSHMYNAACKRHKAGTSEWLIKGNAQFTSWVQNPSSFLWLHGKAGSGKSVLSSSVIHYPQREYKDDASTAVVYYYFTFSDTKSQQSDGMLASLIKQVCCHRPNTPDSVNNLAEYKKKGMRPSTEELQNSFIATLCGFTNVYIIIDALDECPDIDTQREELMKTLHYILDFNLSNLHLFCTSRQEPDIDASLRGQFYNPGRGALSISSHIEEIEGDIGKYIDSTLSNANYSSWQIDIKAEVKKVLIKKSDGMFQYIRCQFDALQKLRNSKDIRLALDDLPKGLDETYNRMLQGIDVQYRKSVANSLKWLAFSIRPLKVDDLAEIFIMQPHDDVVIDSTERLFNAQDVLIYFSGLIVENRGIVRLAHFSIKEYLVSNRMRQDLVSTFSFSDIDAHLLIAYSCFSYLSYVSTLANERDKETRSLKVYATSNCLIHLEMVPSEHWHVGVIDKLAQALAIRSQSLLNIISHFMKESSDIVRDLRPARLLDLHLRPYCLAAYYGFVRLTGCLLSQAFGSSRYLTQGDLNTALWYAVYGGRKDVAVLLLERGADPNTSRTTSNVGYEYEEHGDVLQMAVSKGDAVMVNLLLDRGADINAQRWGSALQTATDSGHLDILKLLVGRAANINGPSNEKRSVLHAAIRHEKCFQFLLDSGADVNMRNQWGQTALCEAARFKRFKQFDLLLEKGADVNLGGEGGYPLERLICLNFGYPDGNTSDVLSRIERLLRLGADPNAQALHAAVDCTREQSASYYLRVTQLLIDNGADVNIRACVDIGNEEQQEPQSLLYHCAYRGYTPMAKLLLQNGATASVNLQAGDYGNALQAASYMGEIEMMRLLLDHGAQVNAQGGCCGTALNAACCITSDDDAIPAVQLLLEHGADVKTGFALQTVCARSSPDVATTTLLAQILLDHGADINARGGKYGTALQAASHQGNRDVMQLLLDRGANVNAEGGELGTALQAALKGFNQNSVQLLLDRGADVNANGGLYGSCLQIACANRYIFGPMMRTLLQRGADPQVQRGQYLSPLHCIAASFHIPIDTYDTLSQLLLEHGAQLNLMDNKHGTALHYVLSLAQDSQERWRDDFETRWIGRIRFLLEHGADASLNVGEQGSPLHVACSVQYDCESLPTDSYETYRQFRRRIDERRIILNLTTKGAETLLDICPNIDINAHGGIFGTALQAAAYSGQAKTVQLLLSRKDHKICNKPCGKYGSALNAAVIRAHWDIVDVLLEAGAKPDCHVLQEPDQDFLARIREEHGWAAEERYKKFWEVEKKRL